MDDVEKPVDVDVDVVTAVVEATVDDTLVDELLDADAKPDDDEALTTRPGFGGRNTTGQGWLVSSGAGVPPAPPAPPTP